MRFCREFKCLPESGGYLDQPADMMVRWQDYMVIEGEALKMRRKIDESQNRARRR